MKLLLIHLADMFDNWVLRHRFYWVCQRVSNSSWWGEFACGCLYCRKFQFRGKPFTDYYYPEEPRHTGQ
jgi:hypothetical protein